MAGSRKGSCSRLTKEEKHSQLHNRKKEAIILAYHIQDYGFFFSTKFALFRQYEWLYEIRGPPS